MPSPSDQMLLPAILLPSLSDQIVLPSMMLPSLSVKTLLPAILLPSFSDQMLLAEILLPSLSDQTTSSKPDLMDERVKLLIGRRNLKYLDVQIVVHEAIQKEIALKVSSNHSNWNKIQSTLRPIPHSEEENNANTFRAGEKI